MFEAKKEFQRMKNGVLPINMRNYKMIGQYPGGYTLGDANEYLV